MVLTRFFVTKSDIDFEPFLSLGKKKYLMGMCGCSHADYHWGMILAIFRLDHVGTKLDTEGVLCLHIYLCIVRMGKDTVINFTVA